MAEFPFSKVPRATANLMVARQRDYSSSQAQMAQESPHLIWVHRRNKGVDPKLRRQVWDVSADKCCVYCGCQLHERFFTVDHVRPVSRNGTDDLDNLVLACPRCNSKKGARING